MTCNDFFEKHIYNGLTNLNDGFDVPCIEYFSMEDFKIVLERVDKYGIRIGGIECWPNKMYAGVKVPFDYINYSGLPPWHWQHFRILLTKGLLRTSQLHLNCQNSF